MKLITKKNILICAIFMAWITLGYGVKKNTNLNGWHIHLYYARETNQDNPVLQKYVIQKRIKSDGLIHDLIKKCIQNALSTGISANQIMVFSDFDDTIRAPHDYIQSLQTGIQEKIVIIPSFESTNFFFDPYNNSMQGDGYGHNQNFVLATKNINSKESNNSVFDSYEQEDSILPLKTYDDLFRGGIEETLNYLDTLKIPLIIVTNAGETENESKYRQDFLHLQNKFSQIAHNSGSQFKDNPLIRITCTDQGLIRHKVEKDDLILIKDQYFGPESRTFPFIMSRNSLGISKASYISNYLTYHPNIKHIIFIDDCIHNMTPFMNHAINPPFSQDLTCDLIYYPREDLKGDTKSDPLDTCDQIPTYQELKQQIDLAHTTQ